MNVQFKKIFFHAFFVGILSLSTSAIAQNVKNDNLLERAYTLEQKQKGLQDTSDDLLKRLIQEQAKELERMRLKTRSDMDEWENDPDYINGVGLKASLYNAREVALGYGFDVERLQKMYALTKAQILNLEMVGKCGEGDPQLKLMGDTVESISSTTKGAMDWFGFAANEEKRLACVQTQKLKLYKEVNRAYIYALTAKSAQESADSFRNYANIIQRSMGSDASFLVEQAKKRAAEQENVVLIFELTPVVGDLLDLFALGTGTNALGVKLTDAEYAVTMITFLTPEVASQLFKRYPETFTAMKSFVGDLIKPKGGFFDSIIIRTGQEIAPYKEKLRKTFDEMIGLEDEIAEKIVGKVVRVTGESVDAITKRLSKMPPPMRNGLRISVEQASNMIPKHFAAMREVAMKKPGGKLLMFRPFNELGFGAMEEAVEVAYKNNRKISTKWMDVKPKSSSNPLLGAGIPADPSLSKLNDALIDAKEVGNLAAIAKAEKEIAEMNKLADDLFTLTDTQGRKIVNKANAKYNEVDVMWAVDTDGNKVIGIIDDQGRLYDPLQDKKFEITTKPKNVEIILDKNSQKVLPDYDILAVGVKSGNGTDGVVVEKVAGLGNINRQNLETITEINTAVYEKTLVRGDVVHHGAANAWKDPPDYPITAFLPDGSVVSITEGPGNNPALYLKDFIHQQKKLGLTGIDPDPRWEWPSYDPYYGFRTEAEKLAMDAEIFETAKRAAKK